MFLERRRSLSAEQRRSYGWAIQCRLLETRLYLQSRMVGLYSPVRNEVPTNDIFEAALRAGKRTVYPKVVDTSLEFVEVSALDDFRKGAFGIPEPTGTGRIDLADLDLLIVPGVAFDLRGGRLGYGKGFYDRALAVGDFSGRLVGLCYEAQLLPHLPRESHDILMDIVITEERTLFTKEPSTVL